MRNSVLGYFDSEDLRLGFGLVELGVVKEHHVLRLLAVELGHQFAADDQHVDGSAACSRFQAVVLLAVYHQRLAVVHLHLCDRQFDLESRLRRVPDLGDDLALHLLDLDDLRDERDEANNGLLRSGFVQLLKVLDLRSSDAQLHDLLHVTNGLPTETGDQWIRRLREVEVVWLHSSDQIEDDHSLGVRALQPDALRIGIGLHLCGGQTELLEAKDVPRLKVALVFSYDILAGLDDHVALHREIVTDHQRQCTVVVLEVQKSHEYVPFHVGRVVLLLVQNGLPCLSVLVIDLLGRMILDLP